jgi:HAMP domain-containing protein
MHGAHTVDRIAELEAELAEMTRKWEAAKKIAVEQGNHCIARRWLEEQISRLREAAAPLTDLAAHWDCPQSGSPDAPDSTEVKITLGQVRALNRAVVESTRVS